MAYTVYHDRKPAHSSEIETDTTKQTNFTFCARCNKWFKTSAAKPEKGFKLNHAGWVRL